MLQEEVPQVVRAGSYVRQGDGYRAFIPSPLPPTPPLRIDEDLLALLSPVDQALGRLDASADMLPNPDLFVGMYVRKEAVLSSQIEGTQASLSDVLEYEASAVRREQRPDIAEVVNYVRAMNHGLERLKEFPLSNRLLREIHAILFQGVRGAEKSPGEFRQTQNYIVAQGRYPATAAFVPPPPEEVEPAMAALERYMHREDRTPVLIKAGLIHSQFETIHPFLDGNGRMGRLLITFFLCHEGVLKRPLLYLSAYFKTHRDEYYQRLQSVRDEEDYEGWMRFFLTAVGHVAKDSADIAHEILLMREKHRQLIQEEVTGSVNGFALLDYLYQSPYITVAGAADMLQVSYPTANNLTRKLAELGLLQEISGQKRNRLFLYKPYVELLLRGTEAPTVANT